MSFAIKPKRLLPALKILGTLAAWATAAALISSHADAKLNPVEVAQKTGETQIRHLIEPLLDKFCHDECKLLSVNVTVDVATPDEVAPGFDDVVAQKGDDLTPSNGRIRILMDDKVGPVSRQKLVELVQQYLDTLDFPVKIETQLAHFPQPVGSEGKIGELRERVIRQFRGTLDDLFAQFCPEQCLLADFNLATDVVNGEEAQYGSPGEFVQDGGTAIKVKDIAGTILVDDTLTPEERQNILEMAKLKTNFFKNVSLQAKSLKFPHPLLAGQNGGNGNGQGGDRRLASEKSDSKSNSDSTSRFNNNSSTNNSNNTSDNATHQERFERVEKIERVESGDAVQAELQKFKVYGLIFACSILSLLIFLAMASYRPRRDSSPLSPVTNVIRSLTADPTSTEAPSTYHPKDSGIRGDHDDRNALVAKRYEIERLLEDLTNVFATQPKVAKQVFSRVLTEEGVETTAQYIHLFGESIVVDMLRDPSLQSDLSELMEFYAKNPIELTDDEKLELLRKLHNRTVAGKLVVMGNRSSNLFDFLADMDGLQIMELIRNESLTVKSIVLTQVDPQKRAAIYSQLDEDTRMKLLTELSRIDYLPRDYIFNVANALKRKRKENPRLNTESLPGSEVLVNLLERTGTAIQRAVVKQLEITNPESARTVKSKLVSLDTLTYLRDGQLLEVVLSLRHDELLQFLKGAPSMIRNAIFAKSPKELIAELEDELTQISVLSREAYQAVERKVLNRMKMMANEGLINLVEVNERMFSDVTGETGFISAAGLREAGDKTHTGTASAGIKKVAGW